jgi:hypothetical protein
MVPMAASPSLNIDQILSTEDLVLKAIVCSEAAVRDRKGLDLVRGCQQEQKLHPATLQASAVAKLLRLPELAQPIRAPVSLPLEWQSK